MLEKWFKEHITTNFPEFNSDALYIAVSGGIDSMVLCELMDRLNYQFTILHCNFQLREESREEAAFIEQWAKKHQQKVMTTSFNTTQYAKNEGLSIQMAARELRYIWFESKTKDIQNKSVLLAHHQDDLVETFLINLSRGSGINGLKSIPERRDFYKRPLLAFSKADIRKYALDHHIKWKEDTSNQKNDYLRNHIRNTVIPQLQKKVPHINPQIASSVNYLKDIASYMDLETDRFLSEISTIEKDRKIIDLQQVNETNRVLLNHALLKYGFKNELFDQIIKSRSITGKQFYSDTHVCLTDRNRLIILPIGIQENKTDPTTASTRNGSQQFGDHTFTFRRVETPDWQTIKQSPSTTAYFDLHKLQDNLTIRHWQTGDSMNILGMQGSKLLSDIFIDEKISLDQKSRIPLILSNQEIIWCCGIRQSSHACVTMSTTQVLEIKFID